MLLQLSFWVLQYSLNYSFVDWGYSPIPISTCNTGGNLVLQGYGRPWNEHDTQDIWQYLQNSPNKPLISTSFKLAYQ